MARCLLINPSIDVYGAKWPPLGLLYLASALREAGHEVLVHDLSLPTSAYKTDEYRDIDLVGITCSTPNFRRVRDLVTRCRELYQRATIILGGPHISTVPRDASVLGADIGVIGDGEGVIVRIAGEISSKKPVIIQSIYHGSNSGYSLDIEALPPPARDLVPMDQYTAVEFGNPRHDPKER